MFTGIIIIVILLTGFVVLLRQAGSARHPFLQILREKGIRPGRTALLLYRRPSFVSAGQLVTEREQGFLRRRDRVTDTRQWWLRPQVRVADIVRVATDRKAGSHEGWQLVSQWHGDVVIMDRAGRIITAVALGDRSRQAPKRPQHDLLPEKVLNQAGIPLLRGDDDQQLAERDRVHLLRSASGGDSMNPGKSVTPPPFRPVLNFSALQRDVIRGVAFMAMAGNHIATAFRLDMPFLNMAGRCAFPLFALVSGCNMAGKTLRQHSLNRLWLMAFLAQPGYWLAFREAGLMWWQLNILFAFAVVMQVVRFLQALTMLNGILALTALVGYLPLSSASYGIPGLLMLAGALLVWQASDSLRPALFAVWLLLVALLNARHGDVMMLSGVLLTLAVLFCVHGLVPALGRRLQGIRWLAPAYALHLLCIGFLVSIL